MYTSDGRRDATFRVDPQSVARRLPSVMVAWNGRPIPRLAEAALIAGVVEPTLDLPNSNCETLVQMAVRIVGDDYARGFVDGFNCSEALRRKGLRYVHGLDDAREARALLRELPWGRTLLAFPDFGVSRLLDPHLRGM